MRVPLSGSVPTIARPLLASMVRRRMRKILWTQGVLRHADADIIEAGLRDWRAVLTVMGEGPFFFGGEPSGIDAIVFAALATTLGDIWQDMLATPTTVRPTNKNGQESPRSKGALSAKERLKSDW